MSITLAYKEMKNVRGKIPRILLGMTRPVISNPFGRLRVNSVRDLSPFLFSKEYFMRFRSPEVKNPNAHTPPDVMPSTSEASCFQSGIKQILRLRLRMTFKGVDPGEPRFSKELTTVTGCDRRILRCRAGHV